MDNGINLGKLFGIQFRLHYTWFIMFLLVTISLSVQYFPNYYQEWNNAVYWIAGVITSLLFFASVLAHEISHSLVAKRNGIPVRSITLFIFGGVARITREAEKAGIELKMAAAGPACSLAIAALCAAVWYTTTGVSEHVSGAALWLAEVNAFLAVFNLVPGFPLDGGRVLRSLLWRFTGNYWRSTRIAIRIGQGLGYLMAMGGILMMVFLEQWFNGLWLGFVGWFLENTASSSYRDFRRREALRGLTASQVMTPDYAVIPPWLTIDELVRVMLDTGTRVFLVGGASPEGVLTVGSLKSITQKRRGTATVNTIMTPLQRLKPVSVEQDAIGVLETMDAEGVDIVPVVGDGKIVGLVTRESLVARPRALMRLKR